MTICPADRALLRGQYLTDDDVPPGQLWLLRYFPGPKARLVAIYYLNMPGLYDFLGPTGFAQAAQDNLGIKCSRNAVWLWVKILRSLEEQARRAKQDADLQKLSDLKLGVATIRDKKKTKKETSHGQA